MVVHHLAAAIKSSTNALPGQFRSCKSFSSALVWQHHLAAHSHPDKAFPQISGLFHLIFSVIWDPFPRSADEHGVSPMQHWLGLAAVTWWACTLELPNLKIEHLVLSTFVICLVQGLTPFIKQLKMVETCSNYIPRKMNAILPELGGFIDSSKTGFTDFI